MSEFKWIGGTIGQLANIIIHNVKKIRQLFKACLNGLQNPFVGALFFTY